MSDNFLGEIRMFGGNFAPANWALCNGQVLSISQNTALFSLLGTTYGGDGVTTFALPNLQGRLPIDQGQGNGLTNRVIGEASGSESVTLTIQSIPPHNHTLNATSIAASTAAIGTGVLPGTIAEPGNFYVENTGTPAPVFGLLQPASCGVAGGSQPHANLMPSLCVSFIIALEGIFPSRS